MTILCAPHSLQSDFVTFTCDNTACPRDKQVRVPRCLLNAAQTEIRVEFFGKIMDAGFIGKDGRVYCCYSCHRAACLA